MVREKSVKSQGILLSTVCGNPDHSRSIAVSYKRKYVHEALVNCLFKFAKEKVWLGELTVRP